jgi:hypothetical protein
MENPHGHPVNVENREHVVRFIRCRGYRRVRHKHPKMIPPDTTVRRCVQAVALSLHAEVRLIVSSSLESFVGSLNGYARHQRNGEGRESLSRRSLVVCIPQYYTVPPVGDQNCYLSPIQQLEPKGFICEWL